MDKIGPAAGLIFFVGVILNFVFPGNCSHLLAGIIIVFAAPGLWRLIGIYVQSTGAVNFLAGLSGDAFFVYAIHQPLLVITRKIVYRLLPPAGGAAILAQYFLLPFCLVALLVVLNRLLLKIMPAFMGFITGNSYRPHLQRAAKSPAEA